MRVLLSWLRELVDLPDDVGEIARRLTGGGLEVEAIERLDRGLEKVVVAEIRERSPIPETKLSVCRVFDGTSELQIVCGAQNHAAGDHVPLAGIGAVLPDGKRIGKAKLKGVESFGMLCSGRELGADDGVDGLLILARDTVPGTPIAKVLGKDDVAFEINVTPNRADALSHRGVARELSALFDAPLRDVVPQVDDVGAESPAWVEITAEDLCQRFCARVIGGVKIGPSPAWLKRRLEALGQRSINNVVDATNFVLFELGQPLHAYDLDKLKGSRLVARRALPSETLRTLDGRDRALSPDDLVIADAARPVGLAGVMGGESSEVTAETTRLLLESAYFVPSTVRRSSRRHGIHSESSHRFERGVDPETVPVALDRLAQVILEVAGGRPRGAAIDVRAKPFERPRIRLRRTRLNTVLGTEVPFDEALSLLEALSLTVVERDPDGATIEVPGARGDLTAEIDLIEEVARLRGFDSIPATEPKITGTDARERPHAVAQARAREALMSMGFHEAVNYAFVAPEDLSRIRPDLEPIALKNPIAQDMAVMRTSLVPGLLKNLSHNLRHGAGALRLYEIGRVFRAHEKVPAASPGTPEFQAAEEPLHLALVATGTRAHGWAAGKEPFDFFDLKGAIEQVRQALALTRVRFERATDVSFLHPRSAARLFVGDRPAGTLGELHPSIADALELPRATLVAELGLDLLVDAATLVPRYHEVPRYPASLRDLAIVVEERVTAADVAAEIRRADEKRLVEAVSLFDVYRGAPLPEGKKNLAYSLSYRAADRTLQDDEVNRAHAVIVDRLRQAFGAELRA